MTIHPTAVIDPKAELGKEVVVGPYCVIGPEAVLGEGCWLQNQVSIFGPTTIGARNRFHAFCSIGQQTQDLKYAGEPTYLEIGDDNGSVFAGAGRERLALAGAGMRLETAERALGDHARQRPSLARVGVDDDHVDRLWAAAGSHRWATPPSHCPRSSSFVAD